MKLKSLLKLTSLLLVAAAMMMPATAEAQARTSGKPKKLKVVKAECYYTLKPQAGNTYYAKNLVDGNPNTAWAMTLKESVYECDALYGPTITFTLKCKRLSHIVIRNGYGKSATAYKNNSRVRHIYVQPQTDLTYGLEGEGYIIDAELKDTSAPQTIYAQNNKYNNNFREVQLIFPTESDGGFYRGAKWNDLCISEIEFWGW